MPTPNQTLARLEAIESALASGATRVSYDGKSVDYRTVAEMYNIRDALRRELGINVAPRRTVAGFSSGF